MLSQGDFSGWHSVLSDETWEPLGAFCLATCIVTLGFDFKDFNLLSREEFVGTYPQHASLARLTGEFK